MAASNSNKYTPEDLKFRADLASQLATIEGKIDNLHTKLEPVMKLQDTVIDHDRQINRWVGVNATLGVLFAAAVAIFSHWYFKLKQVF